MVIKDAFICSCSLSVFLNRFEFIGKNFVKSDVIGNIVTVDVAKCDRIQVKTGDVIGLYFPWSKLGVEWTKCKMADHPDFSVSEYREDESTLKTASVYQFRVEGCRMVSMRAVVGKVPTCSLPAPPQNAVKVTPGDTVTVGETAEYRCKDGFSLTSGKLERKCLACNRKLDGDDPVCSAAA